jgi:hypothetical protein
MREQADAARIAMFLADLIEPAELECRAANGLVPCQPIAQVRIDLLIEVEAHFFVELALDTVAPE